MARFQRKKKETPRSKPAAPKKRRSKEVVYQGITFDSRTEYLYYLHLQQDPEVVKIITQPAYQIIKPYSVTCRRCRGSAKVPSPRTGKPINCTRCKGQGKVEKQGAVYTADFLVEYVDGYTEVIDVKGYVGNQKAFFIRRRLFETLTGVELIIVKQNKTKTGWIKEK